LECQKITFPKLPVSFPKNSGDEAEVSEWVSTDPEIRDLREAGVWSNLHDRVARFERPYLAAEHSAQQPSERLRYYEREFRKGRINLLSCSTTMEMGVDIGGLAAVVNTNVPPSPTNYRQRVGRAGRRSEAMSLALTFVRDEPLGRTTFTEPTRPLTANLRTPKVKLDSPIVVQRHVNAYLLSSFLRLQQEEELHKLEPGFFFGRVVEKKALQRSRKSIADRFIAWCLADARMPEPIVKGLGRLVWGTALKQQADLFGECANHMNGLQVSWQGEVDALAEELAGIRDGSADRKRLLNQLERQTSAYLLGELAGRSFLPAYGYPTNVVPFLLRLGRRDDRRLPGDDNRFLLRDSPSRELRTAIRDYAPGAEVVLDGLVYRCAGVRLNWRRPDDDSRLPQALRWAWRCQSCNASGDAASKPSHCAECGKQNLQRREYLQPAGFTIDTADRPHTDVTQIDSVRPVEPNISANDARWTPLPNPEVGRMRHTRRGSVFHSTLGQQGHGYALCLHCGRAEPEHPPTSQGLRPLSQRMKEHRPLSSGQQFCTGTQSHFAIRRHLALGAFSQTDVFELQVFDLSHRRGHEHAAHSVSIALREALCRDLGVENSEVGWSALYRSGPEGQGCWSIFLYDQASGGAGLATQAADRIHDLLQEASRQLNCSNRGCVNACSSCILTQDSRFHMDKLDRKSALDLLQSRVLPSLQMPEDLQVFGSSSAIEVREVAGAISGQLKPGNLLQLPLGGDSDLWELDSWSARLLVDRALHAGCKVELLVEQDAIGRLSTSQLRHLHALTMRSGATVHIARKGSGLGDWTLLAVVNEADRAMAWATREMDSVAPNDNWGQTVDSPLIRGSHRRLDADDAISVDDLRPPIGHEVREFAVGGQLDGTVSGFGSKFWQLIQKFTPDARQLLTKESPSTVSYSDRYLLSPLVIRLLFEVVRSIPGICNDTPIEVSSMQPRQTGQSRYSGRLHDNWQLDDDRCRVMKTMFAKVDLQGSLVLRGRRALPHERRLTLNWADGSKLQVRLDQGFGFWRSGRVMPFDFSSSIQSQAIRLADISFAVVHTFDQKTVLSVGPVISCRE